MVGDSHLGGIMDLLVGALADLALVRDGEVEDGEEGTSLGAVSPMPVPSAFVPDLTLLHEVVIFLRIVGAVVSEFTEVGWVHLEIGRQAGHAAHVLGSGGRWIHPGNDGGSGRCTYRGIGDSPGVDHSYFRKGVEIGSGGIVISIASEMRTVILAGDPKNVRQVSTLDKRGSE